MSLHKEIEFENDICAALAAQGWLHAEGDAADYDSARALFPDEIEDAGVVRPPTES